MADHSQSARTDADTSMRLAMFETLMACAPVAIAFLDTDLRFVAVNEIVAQIDRRPAEEHIGRTLTEVVGHDLAAPIEHWAREVLCTRESKGELEVAGKWPDGTRREFVGNKYPVAGPDDELLGVLIVGIDVTELRAVTQDRERHARRAAREYQRALSDYTQLMWHRIRNPLTTVEGGIITLIDHDLDRSTRCRLLEAMLTSVQQFKDVVTQPQVTSEEERGLRPFPHVATSESDFRSEAARVQINFQQANREIVERHLRAGVPADYEAELLCECASTVCSTAMRVPIASYQKVLDHPLQCVVLPGHQLPAIEDVTERHEGWWVVRKRAPVDEL